MKRTLFILATIFFSTFALADEFAPLFPFVISADAPDNIVNISSWNDAPAGKHGFIRVEGDKFMHDKGRFLLWGTNTCFTMNFPEHAEAEQVAARLARFGFNGVRLHHMDMRDIWGGPNAKSQTVFDPQQLDKLDYYVFQLKKHGIYVNVNLHVSRMMDDRDGFTGKAERPEFDKGLDNFYPPLIDAQKKYARDLLEHVNPYTQTAYKDEPAVAMIEINNENSIVSQWCGGGSAKLLNMPDPYGAEFRKRWNEFLRKKHKTTAELSQAWNCVDEPLGDEMLARGTNIATRIETQKWDVETDSETKYTRIASDGVMRLKVEKLGKVSWHPQLIARKFGVDDDRLYTFSFRARADAPKKISLSLRTDHSPWDSLGFSKSVDLTTEWKTFSFTFTPSTGDEKARLDIAGFSPGVFEFADSSLKPGGTIGLKDDQTLEAGTIPLVDKNATNLPQAAVGDFVDFLYDIEEKYWVGMYRFLKDEIKVKQPVSGTQLHYGFGNVQAKLDYVDIHSYWNHPHFPGRAWDMNNWTVSNRALVNYLDKEILPPLATSRIAGKPYTVSEFDAPFPNQYAAEALPILAAFGRFQNWDGIFHFAYSHNRNDISPKRATSFFDMAGNTVKLAHLPACVAMFRRGDVAEEKSVILGAMDAAKELEIVKRDKGPWTTNFKGLGLDPKLALVYRTALDVSGKQTKNIPTLSEDDESYASQTAQLFAVKPSKEQKGAYVVDTLNSKLLTGFFPQLGDGSWNASLGNVFVKHDKTRLDWSTVSVVSMDGNGFDPSKTNGKPIRVLVTATGLMQNTGMEITKLDGDKITAAGKMGKEPVLCEGIPFHICFSGAKSLKCFPLDESGNRREEIKTDGNTAKLGPEYKTIWYELELR